MRDHDLPVIVFGYGDCTGGAQASFVTHPLVQTYYFGTSMPFAGQIVVSSMPLTSILANYLSTTAGSMQGLVEHPFYPSLDEQLRQVDLSIPSPQESVEDVVERVLSGGLADQRLIVVARREVFAPEDLIRPVKALIHARGCTAAKLIRIAQQQDVEVLRKVIRT